MFNISTLVSSQTLHKFGYPIKGDDPIPFWAYGSLQTVNPAGIQAINIYRITKVVEHLARNLQPNYQVELSNFLSYASVMVLMISVKNACKFGWFLNKLESEELLTIAPEIGKIYCTFRNVISNGSTSCYSAIVSTITESFYPDMN
ncbi:hypothetical protein MTR_3g107340 [Medicago truncatula]|uniref:Uncharacterized protein n=1 Tax=Medicago truncatula TaxID=3880 RepID=G7JB28_MEDTR|nr:hypothetical protein MTR_3g107340 [Medicago truncatula]